MVNFFTDLYRDELIYSAIARQTYYNGDRALRDVQKELFNKDSLIPTLTIGTHIDNFLHQINSRYNYKKLIFEHTIYPYYQLFLPEGRQNEIEMNIRGSGGSRIYLLLGNIAGGLCKKDKIYYCSECVKEDINREGECYIHREHQLEGILVCPHHGNLLSTYCMNRFNCSRVEYIRLDYRLMKAGDRIQLDINEEERLLLFQLSQMAYELLSLGKRKLDKTLILKKYRACLYEKGLFTNNGYIRQNDLYDKLINFYDKKILALLSSTIDNDNEFNWLRMITRNSKRVIHPIRHLLFICFLGLKISDLIEETNLENKPFGIGPWPCLNKVSPHYLENVIGEMSITKDYKSKALVGTFSCSCGFIYSRRGPDKNEFDRYRIGRKKQFGEEWEKVLYKKLSKSTDSLRDIAKEMDCDPKTIQKYAQKLKTYRFIEGKTTNRGIEKEPPIVKVEDKDSDLMKQYAKEIRVLTKSNPELNRTQLRREMQKQYIYLYRRNKKLLNEILPEIKEVKVNRVRVDWESRDMIIVEQLREVYNTLLFQKTMVRITLGRLAKPIGLEGKLYKWIEKNKLPKTKQYVTSVVETVQDYQLRRCKNIIQEMKNNGEVIKLWKVQRKAGIRTKQFKKLLIKLTVDLLDYN